MGDEGLAPVERAVRLYDTMPCERTFREDLEAHLLHGYVFSTPEVFVMGRPVWSGAAWGEIRDPWHVFPVERRDTWLVYLLAGNVNTSLSMLPYFLRYVAWERGGRNGLRFVSWEKLIKRCAKCSGFLGFGGWADRKQWQAVPPG